jgi:RHS repeat-associated protein
VIQTVTPTGTTINYTRDAAGRIVQVAYQLAGQSNFTPVVNNVSYYPAGPVKQITYANGRVLDRSYDQDYVVSSVNDSASGGLDYTFGRDAIGNLTGLQSAAGNNIFGYDALDRLTGVNEAATNALVAGYSYDGTGNRLSKQTAAGAQLYTYDLASHHLLDDGAGARGYDAAGNTTSRNGQKLVYGTDNRYAQLTSGRNYILQQYVHDGRGQRVEKRVKAGRGEVYFAYDERGHLLAEYTISRRGKLNRQDDYLWLDDLPIGVLTARAGTLAYIEPDHLGTPRAAIDPARNVAVWSWPLANDPFGESAPNQDPDGDGRPFVLNLRMPGQVYDAESGLNYNYFRDYDPALGRYGQSDPVGLGGGLNTYGYVGGNPLNSIDPRGLFGVKDVLDMDNVNGFIYEHSGHASVPQGVVDGVNGFANGSSFGLSNTIKRMADIDGGVNECSDSYRYSKYAGWAWGAGTIWAGGLNGGANSVFWAGRGANETAAIYGTRIADTPIGAIFDGLGIESRWVWGPASATFAANASGTATAVINFVAPTSLWLTERAILTFRGIPIVYP